MKLRIMALPLIIGTLAVIARLFGALIDALMFIALVALFITWRIRVFFQSRR
ncbi:hypothetical protein [Sodalis ligni]|uniref:Uncharacterized protein n=1 Tax=Sodalis ligni TaxID=2697027 RepID=A0A4R1NH22_9GAMM|nr:hypothetical protein [Sodalis ligni]TCL06882.1 hypothetical protein EZJ58_5179 [Sodalis ligni]